MSIVVHPGDALTRRQRLVYVIVLGALTALGPLTIDLYLPAFPSLEDDLGVTAGLVQLTLTATLAGVVQASARLGHFLLALLPAASPPAPAQSTSPALVSSSSIPGW